MLTVYKTQSLSVFIVLICKNSFLNSVFGVYKTQWLSVFVLIVKNIFSNSEFGVRCLQNTTAIGVYFPNSVFGVCKTQNHYHDPKN